MDENIRELLEAKEYEVTPEGVFIPSINILARGVFSVAKRGEPEEFTQNEVVLEGLNYILASSTGETAPSSSWYIALWTNDVSVNGATWTAANFDATAGEWTNYDEASHPDWTPGPTASGGRDSFTTKASFTSNAAGQIVRGAALLNTSAKPTVSGVLLAASRLSSDKTLEIGEILDVGYGLQLSAV
jgi:hypothetical protein